jgi:hypothetical protein
LNISVRLQVAKNSQRGLTFAARLCDQRLGKKGDRSMVWGLTALLIVSLIVTAGRRHSRYLDELERKGGQVWPDR